MRRWQIARHRLKSLFLVSWMVISCSAPSDDNAGGGCGGSEASVSCLGITSIAPKSEGGGNTSNVDAFQEVCVNSTTGAITDVERFTDHSADIVFSNRRFPTATVGAGFDISIVGYSVSYRLNQCPTAAQGCPPLTGFTVPGVSIFVPRESETSITLPFVPLRVKNQFCSARGELGTAVPSYTATYTFTGRTVGLNDTVTVTGSAEFTISNFVDSGFSCTGGTRFLAGC